MASLETRVMPSVRKLREMGVGSSEIEAAHHVETQPRVPAGAEESNVVRLAEGLSSKGDTSN
jgi:hypothetical protein